MQSLSTIRSVFATVVAFSMLAGCAVDAGAGAEPDDGFYEGVAGDEERYSLDDKFDRPLPYSIPEDLPALVAPEIIVSLSKQTVHIFDRQVGFSAVYPTGVGMKNSSGRSITPTGHFLTSPDTSDRWYYAASRWDPAYFEGYPFIRLNIKNSQGAHTYGLHGPITNPLRRGFVSHGCMRMDKSDIVEVFYLVKDHPSTPVTIQEEAELDADGRVVDVGRSAALFAADVAIPFGASVGPRPARVVTRGFIGDACSADEDCGDSTSDNTAFCHPAGFCTDACSRYCPDRAGRPGTFCAAAPSAGGGLCMRRVDGASPTCDDVPNTSAVDAPNAADPSRLVTVCAPDSL